MKHSNAEEIFVYVGSYTSNGSTGIYVYSFNTNTGVLKEIDSVSGIANPSFLAVDSKRLNLYAVSEAMETDGNPGGAVAAYSIQPDTGTLTFINKQQTHGAAPCHLSIDHSGNYLLVTNYAGENVCLFPINSDGGIAEAADIVQHEGAGIVSGRQESPHPHSIIPDPSNKYAFTADLGIDKIMVYKLDLTLQKLVPHKEIKVKAGAGPRHFVFHPGGQYAYLINELDSTITAFSYDANEGSLIELQTITALPDDFKGSSSCADIHVSPSGKFLYGSNRGHNSIVVYQINEDNGLLTYVEHQSTLGKTPRNFAIAPNGKFLLAANQDSDTIVTYEIDESSGRLKPTGSIIEISQPVCIKMIT